MVKYEPPYSIMEMSDGKFAVLEYEPGRLVLDGLTRAQAERLVAYLVKLDWTIPNKVNNMEGFAPDRPKSPGRKDSA